MKTTRILLISILRSLLCVLAAPWAASALTATYNAATAVPVTAASYTATGDTVSFTLNFAPVTGTNLTVVKNTGLSFISGQFSNLAQGQAVTLNFGGIGYSFLANYYGGTGNDLVLVWAGNRPVAWGANSNGQLGNNSTTQSNVPVAVNTTGVLAGKTIFARAAGELHSLALCSDGSLAAWGYNNYGQLGNSSTTDSLVPVAVSTAGVLAGKTVIAIAAGGRNSMALCSDGTLAFWGDGTLAPVSMNSSGVLAGKSIVAVSVGYRHFLALCSDGAVAAWGYNDFGQLGNNTFTYSAVPVLVSTSAGTALNGRTVIAVAAGYDRSLAVCSDGRVATWGDGSGGALGNGNTASKNVPDLVAASAGTALNGKTVIAVAPGTVHGLGLCSDGTLVVWGRNSNGQFGDNSTASSSFPVAVNVAGVLAGKTVIGIGAGNNHSMAQCADGTLASWGYNGNGQLGDNTTTQRLVPVLVNSASLAVGERFAGAISGIPALHSLALVALPPPPPTVVTLAATSLTNTGATLNGTVNANNTSAAVSFDYGLTTAYGTTVTGTPTPATGGSSTAVSAAITGLTPGVTYHYRVNGASLNGTSNGNDLTFTALSNVSTLADLSLSSGPLSTAFASGTFSYSAGNTASAAIVVTPTATQAQAGVTVNGLSVTSGTASSPVDLSVGANTITIIVTSSDGSATQTYTVSITRVASLAATYNAATDVAETVSYYTATGVAVNLTLNYAPVTGTSLLAVKNTGNGNINGTFSNLTQGQAVALSFGGITYNFVANYYGGTGNDLVLVWANTRPVGWGDNGLGGLGNGGFGFSLAPVPVNTAGVLAGKTIIAEATGRYHSLALCSDGTLATWGNNSSGQLGNNSTTTSPVPVLVSTVGVLAGKSIIAIAAGESNSLALCSDGTLAAWGYGGNGQLGNNTTTNSPVPVLVNTSGALAGRTVIVVAAGGYHNLALCSDGTLVTWGYNGSGQLGNNSTTQSNVPVLVNTAGALAGKTVSAIAAGVEHSFALCSDGTLATWGLNSNGQLGNNSTTQSNVPVLVNTAGVLAGRTPMAVAGGDSHSLVLCADGSLVSWGGNGNGQLGNGGNTQSTVPVLVDMSGVLAGKTVVGVRGGRLHSLVVCADGTLASWGYNGIGSLGNNTSLSSTVPVTVSTAALAAGERFNAATTGMDSDFTLGMVAVPPPPPTVTTLAATALANMGATLNGTVNGNGYSTAVSFDYGLTTAYGSNVAAIPTPVTGSSDTAVSAAITGLTPGATYHYRVNGTSLTGTSNGNDQTFTTTSSISTLAGLGLSSGTLSPAFTSGTPGYAASVTSATIVVTPTATQAQATVTVNGSPVISGAASAPIDLGPGANIITIGITSSDGSASQTYTVTVSRSTTLTATFNTAADVAETVTSYTATGNSLNLTLNYTPVVGASLTVVKNTGPGFISGQFSNVGQGQFVALSFGGINYTFVANYYCGTGNDLVLQWANTRPVAWGYNSTGQLGNNTTTQSTVPVAVNTAGVLAGKIVVAQSAGSGHSLALCSDGTLAAWGNNNSGQLGNNSTTQSNVPVLVSTAGVLAGRTVIAIAAGSAHSLALCSDGTLAAWGSNGIGQLGNNSSTQSSVPVAVSTAGVLSGKTVVAIAAADHNLAMCADGTLVAWGSGSNGELGNSSTTNSLVPVLVSQTGVLAGKTVTALAAGSAFSLVLCADGTLAAWGYDGLGQLGNNSTTQSTLPVLVNTSGVLAGKTIIGIACGVRHCLALSADGSTAAWGSNENGQLGNNSFTSSSVPILVSTAGVLAGKSAIVVSAGKLHSLVQCSDGTLAAWGRADEGELGNNSTTISNVPVAVSTSSFGAAERFIAGTSGQAAFTSLGLVAAPPTPIVTTLAVTALTATSVTLNGTVNASSNSAAVSFDYGLTTAYGTNVAGTPTPVTGSSATSVSTALTGLTPGTIYHYRVNGTSAAGTSNGVDLTFTTPNNNAYLASLGLGSGSVSPAFSIGAFSYAASVTGATIQMIPTVAQAQAVVRVNGNLVASGAASSPVSLSMGANTITILVTAQDGTTTQTYTVIVTRSSTLNASYNSAADIAETVGSYTATGNNVNFSLNYAPTAGTNLMVVKNTGLGLIGGTFGNLIQGQTVLLNFGGIAYTFVANYYGGTGNDLVLQWASTRPVAWGLNTNGQLGNNSTTQSNAPTATLAGGVLAGKVLTAQAAGASHSLALCSDGTLAAWGLNTNGQLGNGSTTQSAVPVLLNTSGVLAGKTIIAVRAGSSHSLALCSDGTLAAWGDNTYGQLGNNSTTQSTVPVLVTTTGALAGKTVVSIAAGYIHSLALCSDGTLAAWGYNGVGNLGNGGTTSSSVPALVTMTGVLAGKIPVSIASFGYHTLVLCADGTVASWGYNPYGGLGNGSTTQSNVPVLVTTSGVLAGKSVVDVCTGFYFSLALCSDGTLAAWGYNLEGELGNNSTTSSSVPVLVNTSGVLAGKTPVAVGAGNSHCLVKCSDGTVAAWGLNTNGQLGNNSTTQSTVPVLVSAASLAASERFTGATGGISHSLGIVGSMPAPVVTSTAASSLALTTATLNGNVNANNNSTAVSFDYGLTTSYGTNVAATPSTVTGNSITNVSAAITGLQSGTLYHYRVNGTSPAGITNGSDRTFITLSNVATLSNLNADSSALSPAFDSNTLSYTVGTTTSGAFVITPTVTQAQATVRINGTLVTSGAAANVGLTVGSNTITILVTASDGVTTRTYSVNVTRTALSATFNSASDVPETASSYTATGGTVNLALGYAPTVGTGLTVVKNTGIGFINGRFTNLAQGQLIALTFGGFSYNFVANYFGGSGNDLVLQWANTKAFAWGNNANGQLGINSTTQSNMPVAVNAADALASKIITAQAAGSYHSLTLCLDGTVTASGYNAYGTLGNNSTTQSTVPVAVYASGALLGRNVVAVSGGEFHSLALCSDGRVAAWGRNDSGQLGNNSTTSSSVPVLVTNTGVLAGKTIIAVKAGGYFSLALCSDGTLVAWGYNGEVELGNNVTTNSSVPVLVTATGVLVGKSVIAIAAGSTHSLALCSDGTLVGWGNNGNGQLGNNSTATAGVPVVVNTSGVLAGKTIIGISGGGAHSLALCSDGTLAAWGSNSNGQLGNSSTTDNLVPVLVNTAGVLASKTVIAVSAGYQHSFASCADGTLAAWGINSAGNLGNNSTTQSTVPVAVSNTSLAAGERFITSTNGSFHGLAIVATLPPPVATTLAATSVTNTTATMNGSVSANHASNSATVSFEYGLTTAYGSTITAAPASVSGTTTSAVSAALTGLTPGATYH